MFGPGSRSPFLPQLLGLTVGGQKISRSLRDIFSSFLEGWGWFQDWEMVGRPHLLQVPRLCRWEARKVCHKGQKRRRTQKEKCKVGAGKLQHR